MNPLTYKGFYIVLNWDRYEPVTYTVRLAGKYVGTYDNSLDEVKAILDGKVEAEEEAEEVRRAQFEEDNKKDSLGFRDY